MTQNALQKHSNPIAESLRLAELIAQQGQPLSEASFSVLLESVIQTQKDDFRERQLAETFSALQSAQRIAEGCAVEQIVVSSSFRDSFCARTTTVKFHGDELTLEKGHYAGSEMFCYRMIIRKNSEGELLEKHFLGSVGSTDPDKEFVGRFIDEIAETLRLKQQGEQVGQDLRLKLLAEHVQRQAGSERR